MNRLPPSALLLLFSLLLVACAPGHAGQGLTPPATATTSARQEPAVTAAELAGITPHPTEVKQTSLILPISIYIVDDESGRFSSRRSAGQLEDIYERVDTIWSQAGVAIDVQSIQRISLPGPVVQAIAGGDFQPFFDGAGRDFDVPEPSLLNAFYARQIGGPNGIVPFDARLFFVADEPIVDHERVSSHEIGHILGLHHTLASRERLMFPGANGRELTGEEIVVARYVAQGLLDRQR
ncbi:MAG: matrixin family metalloprotease [Chloroflexota bacterium]|nr:MAG: matrixin family metalloprotease [Chloroflexota bacterium]